MKVFVAALEWGIGHTTRVVPLIQQQIDSGNKVVIGAVQQQILIYKEHFADLPIVLLPASTPVYSKGNNQIFSILKFIPRFLLTINRDHKFLKKVITKYGFDMVISDNRYGLYNRKIKSILITHQLNIQLPDSIKFLQKPINNLIKKNINRFDKCQIPDFCGPDNLSGRLSFPLTGLKCEIEYINPLSRLSLVESEKVQNYPELLIIISGPEKQRTVFEKLVLNSLQSIKSNISYLIIRGIPGISNEVIEHSLNHIPAPLLKAYIEKAKYIICRSGYSTIMDLVLLKKTAFIVPTPGQTEQEYLAEYLKHKRLFITSKQSELNIVKALEELDSFVPDFDGLQRFG